MVTSYIFTVHTYWFAILWLFGLGLGLGLGPGLGLGLETSGLGLGLGLVPPGLVNITGGSYYCTGRAQIGAGG